LILPVIITVAAISQAYWEVTNAGEMSTAAEAPSEEGRSQPAWSLEGVVLWTLQ
jgi:hypothetical protein